MVEFRKEFITEDLEKALEKAKAEGNEEPFRESIKIMEIMFEQMAEPNIKKIKDIAQAEMQLGGKSFENAMKLHDTLLMAVGVQMIVNTVLLSKEEIIKQIEHSLELKEKHIAEMNNDK